MVRVARSCVAIKKINVLTVSTFICLLGLHHNLFMLFTFYIARTSVSKCVSVCVCVYYLGILFVLMCICT